MIPRPFVSSALLSCGCSFGVLVAHRIIQDAFPNDAARILPARRRTCDGCYTNDRKDCTRVWCRFYGNFS
jgi:hypothetical protein